MAKRSLPADLADIIEPLREADEYTRLQHIRQRGFYNLITGMPMFLFLLPNFTYFIPGFSLGLDDAVGSPAFVAYLVAVALHWTLFGISCYPQLFMPWVRRHRPDWQSPLIEASLLKRALEKHFWVQFLFNALYFVVIWVALVVAFASNDSRSADFEPSDLLGTFVLGAFVLVPASIILAWQARRMHDGALQWTFLAMLPLAGLLWALDAFLDPFHSYQLTRVVFAFALTAPPLLVGLVRLLAPRRWLIR